MILYGQRLRFLYLFISAFLASALVLASASAAAFCGFYVAGSGERLVNDATRVALMRHGTRTVITMQNAYQGPIEDFALVVPVPIVLQQDNVKTLQPAIFDHLDQLTAPRLVEYWEQDPCAGDEVTYRARGNTWSLNASLRDAAEFGMIGHLGVTVEARFVVGEYKIEVLGASDSLGLETWLGTHGYVVPKGAAETLRPYVDEGMKFFVAKVDPSKVTFSHGSAALSPLRFDFDQRAFRLPVRLGTINSASKQDLLIYVIASAQRYEAANRRNRFIATNLTVKDTVRNDFGGLYNALFEQRLATDGPGVVVTEYAWDTSGCDPCPGPVLSREELMVLGADRFPDVPELQSSAVVTRLHTRIGKGNDRDLVFRKATPVTGGHEGQTSGQDQADTGIHGAPANRFQSRSVIRHQWTGEVACERPRFRIWGERPTNEQVEGAMGQRPNSRFRPTGPISATRSINAPQESASRLGSFLNLNTKPVRVARSHPQEAPEPWWRWAPAMVLVGAIFAARRPRRVS